MAIVGLLVSPLQSCGTRVTEVQLEHLSKDPCAFEGQTISTSGYAGKVSEDLISEVIFTRPGLCNNPNLSANIFSMDSEYYECLRRNIVIKERIKTNFKLQPEPENETYYTKATHVFTISAIGMSSHNSAREDYDKNFNNEIVVYGKVIKQKGTCQLYADEIKRKE